MESYQFYTRYVGRQTEEVTDGFSLSSSDERHATVSGFPVTYHFRNGYVFSMTMPASDIDGLREEYGLNSEDVIFRLQDGGFMILDASNETWLYIDQ